MKPSLVLWDWLGTIEKTENAHFFITNKLLKNSNAQTFEANESDELQKYWNKISFSVRNAIKSRFPLEMKKNAPWVAPYAIGLMKHFHENNIKQCIISNGNGAEVRRILHDMRLEYFDTIIGNEDGFPLKPNPSSILHLCKKYKIKNDENVWFIGDSDQDIECAMHARVRGIQVTKDLSVVWDAINDK